MRLPEETGKSWAILFARGVLGLIFFMAGFWKVFVLTPAGHAHRWFVDPYLDTFLPAWSLWATGVAIPFVELIGGALLLLGWHVREALIALGFVLLIVTFGHLLKEPLYEFHTHVIPRLGLLLFLLWCPREDDRCSLDAWLARRIPASPKGDRS
jgi:thiosulfate dehydrogenase (quinone) large subunit